ncbi:cupin domain-containing protein [Caulobacter sp. KR2-114]|uniref:cupin domain-containing protein n=1 Tax=Caulobacter sp. KR2-114 TaxID=3400912 RepID=UPI003BFE9D5F
MHDQDAQAVIAALDLSPHPEGGWYRETWRAPAAQGERAAASSILFLLEPGQRSHWHRVDASELWLHHAGGALILSLAGEDGAIAQTRLGPDFAAGEALQAVVEAGLWQAAQALDRWVLVACVVAPAFHFAGFDLAPPDWTP